MTRTTFVLILGVTMLFGCISKRQLTNVQDEVSRLKNDSNLLEKRINTLNNENARLQTLSATIEQALNNRLKEKEDSLNYKEKLLKDREFSLKDMKARKEEEQEAFYSLSRKIFSEFIDYDASTLTTKTNCTQAVVSVNDKKLFSQSSNKPEYLATEVNNKAANLLDKHPDLMLTIVCYIDSNAHLNNKEDYWTNAANKSNALAKMLISSRKNLVFRVKSATGQQNAAYTLNKYIYFIEYQFTSNLTPCIPIK